VRVPAGGYAMASGRGGGVVHLEWYPHVHVNIWGIQVEYFI